MNILIIEDEAPTARKLQRMLQEVEPTAVVVGITGSVDESVEWLTENRSRSGPQHAKLDLILMDIELADGQSFDIFKRVPVTCPVIFTTAYDEYAIKAFKVNSIAYLLKPVKENDLRSALTKLRTLREAFTEGVTELQISIEKLLRQLTPPDAKAIEGFTGPAGSSAAWPDGQPKRMEHNPPVRDYPVRSYPARNRFLIKQGQRLFSVNTDDIAYFFSRNKLSFLKTHTQQEWMVDYTMDELEKMLDPQRFFRLNRQIIAGLRAVDKVHFYFNGKLKIDLKPGVDEEVIVSRERAGDFKIWLGE